MKRYIKLGIVLLGGVMLLLNACKDEYYTIDDSIYDGMAVTVRNPLDNDTLRIELYNTDQLMIREVTDSLFIFDSKAFIYTVEHDSILAIEEDGTLKPVAKGTTRVDIVFRAKADLRTSIIVDVYQDYHPVQYLQAASSLGKALIEKDYTFDLAPYVFVYPGHADNKKLYYSLGDGSEQYASINEEGVITGKGTGKIRVYVVSDDNPDAKIDFEMNVVDEILITDVNLHAKLDNVTLGIGEKINLNEVTSVAPSNVNIVNRRLTFEVLEGGNAVSIDQVTNTLTTVNGGSALVRVTSKNGLSKEFTVNVDADTKDLTRAFWTVKTSIVYSTGNGYVVDGSTGPPEHMFDESTTTYLALTKPGKTLNNCNTPSGTLLNFVVDLQFPSKFNSIRWNHRTSNSYVYLRVWGISVEGSNDGDMWDILAEEIRIPNTFEISEANKSANIADPNRHNIALSQVYEYRYVRVTLKNWSDNSGGSTSGSSMNVAEFGLSNF